MTTIDCLTAADLAELELQPAQRDYETIDAAFDLRNPADAAALLELGPAWAVRSDGRLVCVAGFQPESWRGQATVWALFAADVGGAAMLAITRRVRREFDAADYFRISAVVREGFGAGVRWCEMLGMTREGVMRCWGPNAEDSVLFAKVYS